MKRILLTGSTGFIGRSILPLLKEDYEVLTPSRQELNLLDLESISSFLTANPCDILIHAANPNPAKNTEDKADTFFHDCLKVYYNLVHFSEKFSKILYFGSGAEYDKRQDIISVVEDELDTCLPVDPYGFAKHIMNKHCRKSQNIYNLRIFGCYGPSDAKTKFIRDCIDFSMAGEAVSIRQNCYFDYLYVEDLAGVVKLFIENDLNFHDYNVCTGVRIDLVTIAQIVVSIMENKREIKIAKPGLNKEYTASNARLLAEFPFLKFTGIEAGILKQIAYHTGITEK